jgi:hypothetical protein
VLDQVEPPGQQKQAVNRSTSPKPSGGRRDAASIEAGDNFSAFDSYKNQTDLSHNLFPSGWEKRTMPCAAMIKISIDARCDGETRRTSTGCSGVEV